MGLLSRLFGSNNDSPSDRFIVYETGPNGNSKSEFLVGREISREDAAKLSKIAVNGVLYSVHVYRNGELEKSFVPKDVYEKVKAAMADLD
jgi:hypothetical protein